MYKLRGCAKIKSMKIIQLKLRSAPKLRRCNAPTFLYKLRGCAKIKSIKIIQVKLRNAPKLRGLRCERFCIKSTDDI